MFWKKIGIFMVDCLAILLGLAIAAPFFLALTMPFSGVL